jgi:glycogen synthase
MQPKPTVKPEHATAELVEPNRPDATVFEVAWEVCQQVGGIYTVIRSKAPTAVDIWGDRYFTVGPFNPETSPVEFEPGSAPEPIARTLKTLAAEGIAGQFGRWLVTGQPQTILFDLRSVQNRLPEIRRTMRSYHDIDIPPGDELQDGSLMLGYCAARFFEVLLAGKDMPSPVVTHFHEWQGGAAIPEMRRRNVPAAIVFTTHATILGRYEAHQNAKFYDDLPRLDWLSIARRYNIEPLARLERAAAHGCHVLTTVSEVTAEECTHLLDRPCDVVMPNGLNIERFEALHEFQNLHLQHKLQIHRLVMALFFSSYTFDLDQTLYFFTSGRFEYRNKGFDLTLEALARLNIMLQRDELDCTVVFFLITRRPFRWINSEILRRLAMLDELRRNCNSIETVLGEKLFLATARGELPDLDTLLDDYWRLRLKRVIYARQTPALPPIVTHDLTDDANDPVLEQLRYLRLINQPGDPVKVVYHPDFVEASNPLFGMDYDQFVRGCHLGIFPSFYEPWGYTPLECIARGVPAVTSDLSGFGSYIQGVMPDHDEQGMYVARRRGRGFDDSAQALAEWLLAFCHRDRRQRISQRNRVERCSDQFDWDILARNYQQAYIRAIEVTLR